MGICDVALEVEKWSTLENLSKGQDKGPERISWENYSNKVNAFNQPFEVFYVRGSILRVAVCVAPLNKNRRNVLFSR